MSATEEAKRARVEEARARWEEGWRRSGCQNPEWCGYYTCTSECPSLLHHGPGHQSKTHCELTGEHEQHRAEVMREVMYWSGLNASTGFFDESPE